MNAAVTGAGFNIEKHQGLNNSALNEILGEAFWHTTKLSSATCRRQNLEKIWDGEENLFLEIYEEVLTYSLHGKQGNQNILGLA